LAPGDQTHMKRETPTGRVSSRVSGGATRPEHEADGRARGLIAVLATLPAAAIPGGHSAHGEMLCLVGARDELVENPSRKMTRISETSAREAGHP
jgi:hypothetical protein